MKIEEARTEIAVAPDRVWAALTLFDDYKHWHPRIQLSGIPAPGTVHDFSFFTGLSSKAMTTSIKITHFDVGRRLAWHASMGPLVSVEEEFCIDRDAVSGLTIVIHRTIWSGVFSFFVGQKVRSRTRQAMSETTTALLRYLTRTSAPPPRRVSRAPRVARRR